MSDKNVLAILKRGGVLDDVLANCGVDKNSTVEYRERQMADVAEMDGPQLFKRYMTWNGIIGYEYAIIKAVRAIESATGKKLKPSDF